MPPPLPHPLHKGFAPNLFARAALGRELPLHHHLRGNARMVRSRQPQRTAPLHAAPAGQDVHLRLVQHVAHVQAPRHIRRRQQDGERLAAILLRPRSGVGCSNSFSATQYSAQ